MLAFGDTDESGCGMSNPPKDKDQEKGDEVLRRLLKTPPDPKGSKPKDKPDRDGKNNSRKPQKPESN